MIVVTYNMRRGGADRTHWARLLAAHRADVIFAQEALPPAEHLDRVVWRPAGTNRWGTAVFAAAGRVRPIPLVDAAGWAVGADVPHPWRHGRRLAVFSLHVPHGPGGYSAQTDRLLDAIVTAAEDREVFIGGDFNIAISPGGVMRPDTRRELAVRARLAGELGLVNCWSAANPEAVPAQTLRWTGNPAVAYHCDGLFAPAGWRDRLVGCRVLAGPDWDRLSDHNPVVAEFAGG